MNMKTNSLTLSLVLGASAFSCFSEEDFPPARFDATTGYVTLGTDVLQQECAFVSATGWSDKSAPHPETNYYANTSMYTPGNAAAYTFGGNRLVLGSSAKFYMRPAAATSSLTVDNFRMLGGAQVVYWAPGKVPMSGNFRVYNTTSAPVVFGYFNSGAGEQQIGLTWHGDETARVRLEASPKEATCRAWFTLIGDLSDYAGTVEVASNVNLQATCSLSSAHVSIEPFGKVTPRSVAAGQTFAGLAVSARALCSVAPDKTWTVGALSLSAGATLQFDAAATTGSGRIAVTGSYEKSGEGPVILTLPSAFVYTKDTPPEYVVLSLAADVEGLDALSETDFEVVGSVSADKGKGPLPHAVAFVRDVPGGGKELVVTARPIVTLDASSTSRNDSPFLEANKDKWSSHELPEKGKDYLAESKNIYMPAYDSAPYVFEGSSLTLISSSFAAEGYTAVASSFLCDDLYMKNSQFTCFRGGDYRFTLKGALTVEGTLTLTVYGGGGNELLQIDSDISGSGTIKATSLVASSSAISRGQVELSGDNKDFTGKILVTMPSGTKDWGSAPDDDHTTTLWINDGVNLGGPLSAFTADALQLEAYGRLATRSNDVVLATENRGIRVAGNGRICVAEESTLTVSNAVTYAGLLRLTGPGTLALAGRALFGNGTGVPTAGSNVLSVEAGALKPLATNVLDGVALTMSAGTRLVCSLNPRADGMREYGAVNLQEPEDAPFALTGGTSTIDVVLDADGQPSPADDQSLSVGVMTVKKNLAKSVCDKLRLVRSPYRGRKAGLSVRENADGTTATIVATVLPKQGFALILK